MGEVFQRGNLPHWYMPGAAHFVTYRLADTIPVNVICQWRHERAQRCWRDPPEGMTDVEFKLHQHKWFFGKYDGYLDVNRDIRWLADKQVAEMVRENLYHHHGCKYNLLAYVVMSNHVHVLLQPFEQSDEEIRLAQSAGGPPAVRAASGTPAAESFFSDETSDRDSPLSQIMHSLKSYTAHKANRILGRTGYFWHRESYDPWVRDEDEFERIVEYVCYNSVKAGLCRTPQEWRFSSAFDRFQLDGADCGMVGTLSNEWRTAGGPPAAAILARTNTDQ